MSPFYFNVHLFAVTLAVVLCSARLNNHNRQQQILPNKNQQYFNNRNYDNEHVLNNNNNNNNNNYKNNNNFNNNNYNNNNNYHNNNSNNNNNFGGNYDNNQKFNNFQNYDYNDNNNQNFDNVQNYDKNNNNNNQNFSNNRNYNTNNNNNNYYNNNNNNNNFNNNNSNNNNNNNNNNQNFNNNRNYNNFNNNNSNDYNLQNSDQQNEYANDNQHNSNDYYKTENVNSKIFPNQYVIQIRWGKPVKNHKKGAQLMNDEQTRYRTYNHKEDEHYHSKRWIEIGTGGKAELLSSEPSKEYSDNNNNNNNNNNDQKDDSEYIISHRKVATRPIRIHRPNSKPNRQVQKHFAVPSRSFPVNRNFRQWSNSPVNLYRQQPSANNNVNYSQRTHRPYASNGWRPIPRRRPLMRIFPKFKFRPSLRSPRVHSNNNRQFFNRFRNY